MLNIGRHKKTFIKVISPWLYKTVQGHKQYIDKNQKI